MLWTVNSTEVGFSAFVTVSTIPYLRLLPDLKMVEKGENSSSLMSVTLMREQ